MRDYYFISGLPRSGSTLLSGIFRQNPDFYADVTSPLHNLVLSAIEAIAEADNPHAIDDGQRKQILRAIFDAYFCNVMESRRTIFDTHRHWTSKTALLKELFPYTKIIACVRDLPWILDSFERIVQKNSLYGARVTDIEACQTVTTRCDAMMDVKKEGQVIKPYFFLEEGLSINPDMIYIMEYEWLCKDPEGTMRGIYEFLDKPYFEHDFKNVQYENEVFDRSLNLKGLHTVQQEVVWEERQSILPSSVWAKYGGKEFWRTPSAKPKAEFSVKSIYRLKSLA